MAPTQEETTFAQGKVDKFRARLMEEKGEFWMAKVGFSAAVKMMLAEIPNDRMSDVIGTIFANEVSADLSREYPDHDLNVLAVELKADADALIEILLQAAETIFLSRKLV